MDGAGGVLLWGGGCVWAGVVFSFQVNVCKKLEKAICLKRSQLLRMEGGMIHLKEASFLRMEPFNPSAKPTKRSHRTCFCSRASLAASGVVRAISGAVV